MGININDLDSSLQSISASPLSNDENALDNIRELSEKELKISGGTGNNQFFQPVLKPQPVFFNPVPRNFGGNFNINVSSSSSAISSSNSRPVIVEEPEEERPPTTVSY